MKKKLNPVNLGIGLGLSWGIYVLFIGIVAWLFSWGNLLVDVIGSLYLGYSATLIGSIVGGIWGFLDGFIGGYLIAWFYNRMEAK